MSIMRGTKPLPNSLCKRSASACLRTEPNTRNPFETRTFVLPQPIPVDTPVTTTSLLFAIACLPSGSLLICNRASLHLLCYRCQCCGQDFGYPRADPGEPTEYCASSCQGGV